MSKVAEWSADNLERAAKHLKELDASVNAKAAIELAKREQDVEMAREKSRSKEFEAMRSASVANAERTRWEEQRKTLEAKSMHERVRPATASPGPRQRERPRGAWKCHTPSRRSDPANDGRDICCYRNATSAPLQTTLLTHRRRWTTVASSRWSCCSTRTALHANGTTTTAGARWRTSA